MTDKNIEPINTLFASLKAQRNSELQRQNEAIEKLAKAKLLTDVYEDVEPSKELIRSIENELYELTSYDDNTFKRELEVRNNLIAEACQKIYDNVATIKYLQKRGFPEYEYYRKYRKCILNSETLRDVHEYEKWLAEHKEGDDD